MPTLFEKVGGEENLKRIVAQFYQHILADDRINGFFLENVSNIGKLHTTLKVYLSQLFEGPQEYKGPDMRTMHKHMKIKKRHFDITWEHMEAAFLFHGVSRELIP